MGYVWDGSVWKDEAGATITARPTVRDAVQVIAPLGTPPPSWLIFGRDEWNKDNS